ARAHLVADLGEDRARPGLAEILDDKAQCPIEILAGPQHDRQLAGNLAESGTVEPAPSAEFDLQQIAQAPAPVGRLGAQHDLPLALQALDDRGAVSRLGDAVHHLAARGYRRPAKRWHVNSQSFPDGRHDHNRYRHTGISCTKQRRASIPRLRHLIATPSGAIGASLSHPTCKVRNASRCPIRIKSIWRSCVTTTLVCNNMAIPPAALIGQTKPIGKLVSPSCWACWRQRPTIA